MGKKSSSSDSKATVSKLTLAVLLDFSPNHKIDNALCEELLGEMYFDLFRGLNDVDMSRLRTGKAHKQYVRAAKYLVDHSNIRDHILEVWKKWQPYPHRSSFSACMISILEDPKLADAGTPEQVNDLKAWLRWRAESDDPHDQAELMTTLTLLACTIGHWHDTAPLCLPKRPSVPSPEPSSQELEILDQIHTAESQQDLKEVIRLLEKLIAEQPSSRNRLGEYHYRLSLAWSQLMDKTDDYQKRHERYRLALQALNMACEYEHPEALLRAARNAYEHHNLTSCYNYYKRAAHAGQNTPEGGEACWFLYQLGKESNAHPLWQKAAADYLKRASQYGHPEAAKKYREENAVTLSDQLPRSRDTSTGIFCVNADNVYARTLLATKPDSWLQDSGSMTEAPRDRLERKYFFLDDDHARNLSQALRLLQSIKNSGAERNDIAIYLRSPQEQAAPLIDTALACMGNTVIPVRILDDDRLAARVLGYHPLYYPIRNLPHDAGAELNFVVVGDSRCCEWLVREAFWMTTFRNRKITPKITVLAPNADGMVERLMQHCPAMAAAEKQPDMRSDDPLTRDFPLIRAISCGYESKKFRRETAQLLASRNLYIAVDAGSDLQNMELATFLRECAIRSAVQNGSIRSDSMPVITFRCLDTDIASLSRRSVVLNENSGTLWYNNYSLIPFGVAGDQYSWDALTRDLVEALSLDIHMVYCGIDPKEDRSSQQWTDAKNSYLQRSYNRDSSIAVALSLGYRLYHCRYDGNPVLPDFWDIPDQDAIFSERGLRRLSEKLGSSPQIDDTGHWTDINGKHQSAVYEGSRMAETLALAEWEHDRWNRFMISRGWMRATIEQMRTYMAAGNRRQQLYIGRLHPFICPFGDLAELEQELHNPIREYDVQNIRMTGPILTRQWTGPQRSPERSREKSDRERTR